MNKEKLKEILENVNSNFAKSLEGGQNQAILHTLKLILEALLDCQHTQQETATMNGKDYYFCKDCKEVTPRNITVMGERKVFHRVSY